MEYIIYVTDYDTKTITHEVANAIEKQVELHSRIRFPIIWNFIDRTNKRKISGNIQKKRTFRSKIYGFFLFIMGIYLFVPRLMEPVELKGPLIAGFISLTTSIAIFWPWKKCPYRKFFKSAFKLISIMKKRLAESKEISLLVRFTSEGMIFSNEVTISYQDFKTIIETEHIYFLVWFDSVTFLQKKDLVEETTEDFFNFLQEMTSIEGIVL